MSEAMPNGLVRIAGRVAFPGKKIPGKEVIETELALPSADEFSMPGCVSVRSTKSVGKKGDDVDLVCRVSGFPRTFQALDKETGAREPVRQATVTLTVVE